MAGVILTPFNDLVAQSIVAHSDILPEQLITLDNSAKYTPEGTIQNTTDTESLSEIVQILASLNRVGMENPHLCAGEHGPSFRGALFRAATDLAVFTDGRPVRYVELGPEPCKSRAILKLMLAAGMQLQQYIGIDINPESEKTMRQALVPVIGIERFTYWIEDFYKCRVEDFPKGATTGEGGLVTIVTNLGFQEGNDLPSRTGPMLKSLTRPGDLLLSEMQVMHSSSGHIGGNGGTEKAAMAIEKSYLLPEMERFSVLIGQKFGNCDASKKYEYIFKLVPFLTEVGLVNVATTLVSVGGDMGKKYVLTNSCLKYTPKQFLLAREATGDFIVKASHATGDKSVVFQIAKRC